MRTLFNPLCFLLFVTGIPVHAQQPVATAWESMDKTVIRLPEDKSATTKIMPFSGIRVLDLRYDSTKFGFLKKDFRTTKLVTDGGFAAESEKFLNTYYQAAFTASGPVVLMVLRHCWLNRFDTSKADISRGTAYSLRAYELHLKADYYIQNGNDCLPLYRMDTILFRGRSLQASDIPDFLATLLTDACNRLLTSSAGPGTAGRKTYTLEWVKNYSLSSRHDPVLSSKLPPKGIFMDFNEFLQLQPSRSYEGMNQTKYGDVLYVKDENGNEYPTNKFWGFSDGKDLYICIGKNFFKLIRQQDTYEFEGFTALRERYNNRDVYSTGSGYSTQVMHKRKPATDYYHYQVDMETGDVY